MDTWGSTPVLGTRLSYNEYRNEQIRGVFPLVADRPFGGLVWSRKCTNNYGINVKKMIPCYKKPGGWKCYFPEGGSISFSEEVHLSWDLKKRPSQQLRGGREFRAKGPSQGGLRVRKELIGFLLKQEEEASCREDSVICDCGLGEEGREVHQISFWLRCAE